MDPGTLYTLRGRNALVTGGGRGLGLEIARALVARGADVAITGRDAAELDRALSQLRAIREDAKLARIPCDLREGSAVGAMIESVRAELGPIDVLINNAGSIEVGPLDALRVEDFEDAMELHCFAPLRTMLAVREEMRRRGGGRIVNIASIGGHVAVPHLLPYSASKFALVGLSRGMHSELAKDGIAVCTVSPGLMRTGSPPRAHFKGDHAKEYAWFSISDSLPLLSMSSARAAERIVVAIERGEAEVVLGMPAKVLALAGGVAPALVARALVVAASLLPGGSDSRKLEGSQVDSSAWVKLLTTLTTEAAVANNEVPHG